MWSVLSLRPRSLMAVVLCVAAGLLGLLLKGVADSVADLLVSASAGLASRFRARSSEGEPPADPPRRRRPRTPRRVRAPLVRSALARRVPRRRAA